MDDIKKFVTGYQSDPAIDFLNEEFAELQKVFDTTPATAKLVKSWDKTMRDLSKVLSKTKGELTDVVLARSKVYNTNYIRALMPVENSHLENRYTSLKEKALSMSPVALQSELRQLAADYDQLMNTSSEILKGRTIKELSRYQNHLKADMEVLAQQEEDTLTTYKMESLHRRVGANDFGLDFGMDGGVIELPPYLPPPPPPTGPRAGQGLSIVDREATSLELGWIDVSDNEVGSRVMRAQDAGFETVESLGPFDKFEQVAYTDTNLQPDTRYCYKVETFNDAGANNSQGSCAYTRSDILLPVWRVQLEVMVADLKNAGTDNTIRAALKLADGSYALSTYLDYGRDDFERDQLYSFDLNFAGIDHISDIVGFSLYNSDDEKDVLLIKQLSLVVNEHEVFSRIFGTTSSTVLNLGYYGYFDVGFSELRAEPDWQSYVGAFELLPSFILLPLAWEVDGQEAMRISNQQLVSRIEALMGHLIHTDEDLKGKVKWGKLHGAAVEIERKDNNTITVDLDLQAKVNNNFDPELDIDFDITFNTSCLENGSVLRLSFISENFTSNANASWWQDVVSLGSSAIIAKALNWYSENCMSPPSISQSLDIDLTDEIDCGDLQLEITEEGDLVICCLADTE